MSPDRLMVRLQQLVKRVLTDSLVQIEPTRRCNFNCLHCNHKDDEGYLHLETYHNILDRHRDCKVVKLQGLGEPLLHPRIQELVDIAKGRGHKVMIITNGSCGYLNNVDYYVFSLETMSTDTYVALGKRDLERVLENIRSTARRQKVTINCVKCSSTTPHDVTQVKDFAAEIGADVWLTPQEVWYHSAHPGHAAQVQETKKAWRIHGVPDRYRKYKVCNWGVSEFYYDYTGVSHPCCIRMTDEYRGAKPGKEICGSCPL